jgi:16S rRNA C967 or C1407 C5-methylase (RsmB/RsmF family)
MEKPSNLLIKLSQKLFADPSERDSFVDCLVHPRAFSPCILWCGPEAMTVPFELEPPVPWQPTFVNRLSLGQKPGQHEWHQKGYFYCLDFSSVFAISVLKMVPSPVDVLVDMCASPGGKSLFSWLALQPALLVSNEVIGKRLGALVSNLKRCQVPPAIALRMDSQGVAEAISNTAQVVLVDAPCTGQSLLAKGGKAPGCFHPVTIKNNASRQKRILANSAQVVAPQGYLVYMTCAYSLEENEQVVAWLLARFSQFQPIAVPHLAEYQSRLAEFPCYRMFPQEGLGAGAFTALLQNTTEGMAQTITPEFWQSSNIVFRSEVRAVWPTTR